MNVPKISDREVKDPRLLRDRLNQLFAQQYELLERWEVMDRTWSGVQGGTITDEERALLRSLSIGSTESAAPSQSALAPEVTALPPESTSTPGALVVFNNLLYRFDGATRSWLDIGSAAPANMMTTDTNQTPGAAVVKTWTAQQIFGGGLTSAAGLTVTAGQFDSAAQFGARAFHNAAQSIPDVTLTALNLNSESFDQGGVHDTAVNNPRMTIPTGGAGLWILGGQVHYAANALGVRAALIYRNGVTQESYAQASNNGAADAVGVAMIPTVVMASDGDYFEPVGLQNSGGALNTVASRTVFWAYKLS